MKKLLLTILMGVSVLIAVSATAQTIHVTMKIPFSFAAGPVVLPAGDYDIRSIGNGGRTLEIRNVNSNLTKLVIANSAVQLRPSPGTRAVFHRYGGKYFLSQLWVEGNTLGHEMPSASREREYALDYPRDDVVLVAAKR